MGLRVLLAISITAALLLSGPQPTQAAPLDFGIPNGHFFKQTNGLGGVGSTGFSVVDSAVPFWSAFQRFGGVEVLGYPVSRPFEWDGFLVQAFQKAVLQWRPEVEDFYFVNVFDRLSAAGRDDWLAAVRQTPPSFDHSADRGLSWQAVVARHQALLDINPAIRARYFADSDPIRHFGLPLSYADCGSVFVVRAQRAVFQQWKVDVPWARAGKVVVANGGDVAKEAGIYPMVATVPHTLQPSRAASILAGEGRLYMLKLDYSPFASAGSLGPASARLLTSRDSGKTWQPFTGGLPVAPDCIQTIGMDYASPDALYASTCEGLFRWTGLHWEQVTTRAIGNVSVTYGDPRRILATEMGRIVRSNDGGATWRDLGFPDSAATVGVDPSNTRNVYALGVFKSWWFSFWRGTAERGHWTRVPAPDGQSLTGTSMAIDGTTGDVYLLVRDIFVGLDKLWRTTNADVLDVGAVRWELVHEFDLGLDVRLFAAGEGPSGLALYGSAWYNPGARLSGSWYRHAGDGPVLIRSLDGGTTWEALALP